MDLEPQKFLESFIVFENYIDTWNFDMTAISWHNLQTHWGILVIVGSERMCQLVWWPWMCDQHPTGNYQKQVIIDRLEMLLKMDVMLISMSMVSWVDAAMRMAECGS